MVRPQPHDVIGLIPAAGFGTRFPGSGSKEVNPVLPPAPGRSPVLLIDCLLSHLAQGGVRHATCVIRAEKEDIPQALGNGSRYGVAIDYLVTQPTAGTPFTLDAAWSSSQGRVCILGFPDIIFAADAPVGRLLDALTDQSIDIVLALLPTLEPARVDVVVCEGIRVRNLVIKTPCPEVQPMTWVLAACRPSFMEYMHRSLRDHDWCAQRRESLGREELYVGDLIQAAIEQGFVVCGISVGNEAPVDAGTADGLVRAQAMLQAMQIAAVSS